jgi:hypothetical protein
MKSWVILSATAVTLGLAGPASACPYSDLVQSWYSRYFGRPADPVGLNMWTHQLRCGTPAEQVEATLLGSAEYYHRHGCSPHGFIAGLYADVLGHRACGHEIENWLVALRQCGCRKALACKFLQAAAVHRQAPPPAYEPAPQYDPTPYASPPRPYQPAPSYSPPEYDDDDLIPSYAPRPAPYRTATVYKSRKAKVYRPAPGFPVVVRYRSGW